MTISNNHACPLVKHSRRSRHFRHSTTDRHRKITRATEHSPSAIALICIASFLHSPPDSQIRSSDASSSQSHTLTCHLARTTLRRRLGSFITVRFSSSGTVQHLSSHAVSIPHPHLRLHHLLRWPVTTLPTGAPYSLVPYIACLGLSLPCLTPVPDSLHTLFDPHSSAAAPTVLPLDHPHPHPHSPAALFLLLPSFLLPFLPSSFLLSFLLILPHLSLSTLVFNSLTTSLVSHLDHLPSPLAFAHPTIILGLSHHPLPGAGIAFTPNPGSPTTSILDTRPFLSPSRRLLFCHV
ncbi:hypothetical protein LIA77_03165 [Sarocladium implicatum]|nr:hypothetical protein LIA77_03165 [Sarocladium implicatum]